MQKKINNYFTLLFILGGIFINAQHGFVVEYEQVSIPNFINSDGTKQKLDKEFLASFAKPTLYELQIIDKQSFYFKIDKISNLQGGSSVTMIGVLPRNLFLDFNANLQKREWEVENKKYIVVGSIEENKYQLTREKSTYLGYEVKQAVKISEYGKTVIWYAPDLPSKFGPSTFINLPGLVLKVESFPIDSDEANFTLKATSVLLKENIKFNQLFKAKEITSVEFKSIEEEYIKKASTVYEGVDKE